jgi:protein-S-isoprenylcysteine O-methyltransferase Ste14
MGFRESWINFLHRAATGTKKTRTLLTPLGVMVFGLFTALFLFGVGFGVNSVSLVFFFTPLFVLINAWELKQIEEPELMKRLGDEYIEYRRQTPMFLPRFRPRAKSNA